MIQLHVLLELKYVRFEFVQTHVPLLYVDAYCPDPVHVAHVNAVRITWFAAEQLQLLFVLK